MSRWRTVTLGVVLVLAGVASVDALQHAVGKELTPARPLMIALSVAAIGASLAAIVRFALAWRRGSPPGLTGALARALFYALTLAVTFQFVLLQPCKASWTHMAGGLGLGAFAGLAAFGGSVAARWPRAARVADVALMNACLIALGSETALRIAALFSRSPYLTQADARPHELIERYRLKPGTLHYGFPVNRDGYVDEEPGRRRRKHLVVCVGDSFSTGVVPHAYHYTTVAERALGDCEIYNLGVPSIGLPEYAWLVAEQAMPMLPDAIVIGLYIGNDVHPGQSGVLRYLFDRDNLLLYQVPHRLARVARGRAVDNAPVTEGPLPVEELPRRFPWLEDPLQEPPSHTREAFLEIETRYARTAGQRADLRGVRHYMDAIRTAAGRTPVVVLLIPTEAQVEDVLWAEVVARAGALDRDAPQQRVMELLSSRGFTALNLAPVLRGVAPLEDGRRHVYHRHDTHWNARGNRVAGDLLAVELRALLQRR